LDVIYKPGQGAGNLIWTGGPSNSSNQWDTNVTANWNNIAASVNPDKFLIRDNVTFDNTASVPHAITLTGAIAPQTMTVNSDGANAFSFSGTGKLSGTGSLTKSGTSTLTMSNSNDYTGGSTINNGTVILLDTGSTPGATSGLGNGVVNIAAGAVVRAGNGTTAGAGTIAASIIHNAGSVIINRNDASTLSAPMDGAGTLAVQGGGVLTVSAPANANIYSGNTTVSGGSTLQPAGATAMSANSVIVLDNTAGSRFTPNGFDQVVGGLSGGGASSGDVSIGANNFTFAGNLPTTFNYAGPISSNGGGTIFMGRVQNVNDETLPTAVSRSVALTSRDAVQTLSGPGPSMTLASPITVRVGTLDIAPSTPGATIGATNRSVNITAPITLPFGTGTSTPPNQQPPAANLVAQATLKINANTNLIANNFTLNPGQNSLSNFIQDGGTVNVVGTTSLSNSAGGSTMTINNGSFVAGGTGNISGAEPASIQMSVNPGQQAGAPPLPRPYEFSVINVNGGTLSMLNQLSMGLFFNGPATVNQNGGLIQFVSDTTSLTPGGTGGWICVNNNNANFGRYIWNLNGGVTAMNQAKIFLTADTNPQFNSLNLNPVMNFNGGTLRALSDQATAMFDFRYRLVSQAKGGTVDTNAHTINFVAPISHDATLGATKDGGITIADSVGGGKLTFSVANTYTGPTAVGPGGRLEMGIVNALPATAALKMAGGTFAGMGFSQTTGGLKTTASSTIDMTVDGTVQFSDSTLLHWVNGTGATLHVANWNSGSDHLLFPSVTSLTGNQLNQIVFDGSGLSRAQLVPFGGGAELVPTNNVPTGILKFGDINQDGVVNNADIPAFLTALTDLNAYKTLRSFNDSQMITVADTNYDDIVTNSDIQTLLNLVAGGGGSLAAVPEPSTLALLAIGGAFLVGRRVRTNRKAAAQI